MTFVLLAVAVVLLVGLTVLLARAGVLPRHYKGVDFGGRRRRRRW